MKEMPKYNANLLEHLNPYELKVLMFLLLEPPGEFEMSQREVSEATGISGATVCRVLKSLEEKRAISRYLSRGALLHKSAERRGSPFPGRTYPTASVTGMPSAV
jgi:DNA-binding MurR/RpiR family transcriptional regulator